METLHEYLIGQSANCRAKAAALTEDQRFDEAVFEKIRCNVFDIFAAVLTTAQKQPDAMAFFRRQLSAIPANWEAALETAKLHGDEGKAHTETVKLEAVAAIRARLEVQR